MNDTLCIDSPRFGKLEVAPDRVIEFPEGIPGFEDLHQFTLFHPEGGDPKYFLLQSIEQPALAFPIADPGRFGFSYEIELSDAQTATLALEDPADVVVAVMLIKNEDQGGEPLRANLNAPLVLNLKSRRGIQHVFASLDYQVTLKSHN
jgi:flagellar assembly factor FliW